MDGYRRAMLGYLEEQPTDTVLPSIDSSVTVLHLHRDAFGRLSAPAVAAPEAVDVATSKRRTLEVAASLGIRVPRSLPVTSAAEVDAAVAEVGFPAVLKPDESWLDLGGGGERVNPVWLDGPEDAREAAAHLLPDGATALVQEVAPGLRETVKLFRHDGRWLARLVMTVDRSWPPLGGSSVMRATVAPPQDVLEAAERLVAEIGLEGYSEVEFRRGPDGEPLLMEVNPRLSQSVELAVRAGVDFPRMQLEWARGGRIEPASRYAVGVRVGWLAGEARLLAGSLLGSPPPRPRLAETAPAIARDYLLRRARIEGLDLDDPKPVVGALAFTARAVTRRGTRRPSPSPG